MMAMPRRVRVRREGRQHAAWSIRMIFTSTGLRRLEVQARGGTCRGRFRLCLRDAPIKTHSTPPDPSQPLLLDPISHLAVDCAMQDACQMEADVRIGRKKELRSPRTPFFPAPRERAACAGAPTRWLKRTFHGTRTTCAVNEALTASGNRGANRRFTLSHVGGVDRKAAKSFKSPGSGTSNFKLRRENALLW